MELFAHTFEKSKDLLRFSDAQLSDGFSYMLDNSCSDTVFALMDECVSLEQRKRAIAAIKYVYADCFEQRCSPVLGHLDEPGANALNQICYMLWDVSPLTYWDLLGGEAPSRDVLRLDSRRLDVRALLRKHRVH